MAILRILKGDRGGQVFMLALIATLVAVPVLAALPADNALHMSSYTVTLLGKYLTYVSSPAWL